MRDVRSAELTVEETLAQLPVPFTLYWVTYPVAPETAAQATWHELYVIFVEANDASDGRVQAATSVVNVPEVE